MAQKKLLLLLISLLFVSTKVLADEKFEFKAEDLEYAKDLTKRTMQMNMPTIKEKWYDLQEMLGHEVNRSNGRIDAGSINDTDELTSNTSLRIFVSSSMSINLLKSYAKSAKKYNAVLVFQGLPDGSWHKLSNLVSEISGNDNAAIAMQIDDEAFNQFGITNVPSFVLAKEEDVFSENPKVTFDKVTGSIGIKKALEVFADAGQLADIARDNLEAGGGIDE
jgi:type-F conjugative transfer system pilin assembly protein TrbC